MSERSATATSCDGLDVRPFRAADQALVRRLILDGLGGRWGYVDEDLNGDLADIGRTYGSGLTLTAWIGEALVGTGTLVPRSLDCAEVLRMSTAVQHRGRGIASCVLHALLDEARRRGVKVVVLETAAAWEDARSLYESHGFVLDREADGEFCRDAFYRLELGRRLVAATLRRSRGGTTAIFPATHFPAALTIESPVSGRDHGQSHREVGGR